MYYKSHKIIYVEEVNKMNEILEKIKRSCVHIYYREKDPKEYFKWNAFITIGDTLLCASFREGTKKPVEYRFSLAGDNNIFETTTGGEAFRISQQYYKIPRLESLEMFGSASQLLYKNKRFDGKRVRAYSYDMNSAFPFMMLQPIPNTDTLEFDAKVGKGQIGFYQSKRKYTNNMSLEITFEIGRHCEFVCDLMPSPFVDFIKKWYDKKRKASNFRNRQKAKDVMNMAVGVMQNYNPLIRACIIGRCNKFFESLIDSNTIYANTDSIVSVERRKDIEEMVGDSIGQFKFERNGEWFAWQKGKMNYQWNDELPTMRGVPKRWFDRFEKINKRKFDILLDYCPDKDMNEFVFDKDKFVIRGNEL